MTRLGLRLALTASPRQLAVTAITVVAVACGFCLLLLALSVRPALQAKADRAAWLSYHTVIANGEVADEPYTAVMGGRGVTRSAWGDIETLWVASSGAGSPVVPTLDRNPLPGESFVSPSLRDAMSESSELAERYGPVSGTLDKAGLASPETLMVVRHLPEREMDPAMTSRVTGFATEGQITDFEAPILKMVVAVGAVAMLSPVIFLVVVSTRLSTATRERRIAALRLSGATPSQIARLTAVESAFIALIGLVAGFAGFQALRPLATQVTLDTDPPWYKSDIHPGNAVVLLVGFAVAVSVVVVTQLNTRRATNTPFATARQSERDKVEPLRLFGAVVLLVVTVLLPSLSLTDGKVTIAAFVSSIGVLLLAGPWVTRALGHVLGYLPSTTALISSRQLIDKPHRAFRAVAAIPIAVLITIIYAAVTPAALAAFPEPAVTSLRDGIAIETGLVGQPEDIQQVTAELQQIDGISRVATPHTTSSYLPGNPEPISTWFASCPELQELIEFDASSCATADVLVNDRRQDLATDPALPVLIPAGLETAPLSIRGSWASPDIIIDPTALDPAALPGGPPNLLLVRFETPEALEAARTVVDQVLPGSSVQSQAEVIEAGDADGSRKMRSLLVIASMAAFTVSGLTLAIAMAIGLLERRRAYAQLRCAGVTVGRLRRLVLVETIAPLAITAAIAVIAGLAVAFVLLDTSGISTAPLVVELVWPPLIGVTLAVVITLGVLPFVQQATALEELHPE